MITGLGKISDGIREFTLMKEAEEKCKGVKMINDVVEIRAEDIEENLLKLI